MFEFFDRKHDADNCVIDRCVDCYTGRSHCCIDCKVYMVGWILTVHSRYKHHSTVI